MDMLKQHIVQESRFITSDTLLLTIEPRRAQDTFLFSPGQYVAIGFKRFGRPSPMRCFSIVSSPNGPKELQLAVRVQGNFTRSLAALERGDHVFVRGPFGNFVIDEIYDRNIFLVAGGIGITPFMSMIRYATEMQLPLPITLLYSCTRQEHIPFFDELHYHEQQNPNFRVIFFITKDTPSPVAGRTILSGRIDRARLKQLSGGQLSRSTYFLCGPKPFTHAIRDTLTQEGADPHRIITEEFTPSTPANTITALSPHAIPRWTYALTGASLMLAAAFFMVLDVGQVTEKAVTHTATPAATRQSVLSNTTDSSTAPAGSMASPTNTMPTYQPTYQQPMTSVS